MLIWPVSVSHGWMGSREWPDLILPWLANLSHPAGPGTTSWGKEAEDAKESRHSPGVEAPEGSQAAG